MGACCCRRNKRVRPPSTVGTRLELASRTTYRSGPFGSSSKAHNQRQPTSRGSYVSRIRYKPVLTMPIDAAQLWQAALGHLQQAVTLHSAAVLPTASRDDSSSSSEAAETRDVTACVKAAVACRQQLILLPVLPRATWHTLLNDFEIFKHLGQLCAKFAAASPGPHTDPDTTTACQLTVQLLLLACDTAERDAQLDSLPVWAATCKAISKQLAAARFPETLPALLSAAAEQLSQVQKIAALATSAAAAAGVPGVGSMAAVLSMALPAGPGRRQFQQDASYFPGAADSDLAQALDHGQRLLSLHAALQHRFFMAYTGPSATAQARQARQQRYLGTSSSSSSGSSSGSCHKSIAAAMHLVTVTLQCISCCLDLLPEGTVAPPACLRNVLYFTCEVALIDVASFGTEHTAGSRVRTANSEGTFAEMLMSPHYLEGLCAVATIASYSNVLESQSAAAATAAGAADNQTHSRAASSSAARSRDSAAAAAAANRCSSSSSRQTLSRQQRQQQLEEELQLQQEQERDPLLLREQEGLNAWQLALSNAGSLPHLHQLLLREIGISSKAVIWAAGSMTVLAHPMRRIAEASWAVLAAQANHVPVFVVQTQLLPERTLRRLREAGGLLRYEKLLERSQKLSLGLTEVILHWAVHMPYQIGFREYAHYAFDAVKCCMQVKTAYLSPETYRHILRGKTEPEQYSGTAGMLPVQYSQQYLKAAVQMLQYNAAHLQDVVAAATNSSGSSSSSSTQVGAEDAHYALGLLRMIATQLNCMMHYPHMQPLDLPFREAWRPQTSEHRAALTASNMPVWRGQGLSLLQGLESAVRAAWHAGRPPIYRRASAADSSVTPKDGFRAVFLAVLYLCHSTLDDIYGPLTAAAVAAGLGSAEEQQLYSLMGTLLKCGQQMQGLGGIDVVAAEECRVGVCFLASGYIKLYTVAAAEAARAAVLAEAGEAAAAAAEATARAQVQGLQEDLRAGIEQLSLYGDGEGEGRARLPPDVAAAAAAELRQLEAKAASLAAAAGVDLDEGVIAAGDSSKAAAAGDAVGAVQMLPWLVLLGRCFLQWSTLLTQQQQQQRRQGSSRRTISADDETLAGMDPSMKLFTETMGMYSSQWGIEPLVMGALDALGAALADISISARLAAAAGCDVGKLKELVQETGAATGASLLRRQQQQQRREAAGDGGAGRVFVLQLQALGLGLTSLAFKLGCNNPGCSRLADVSELQLVKGRSKRCGGCGTARYCSKECQEQHWQQHKPVCKAVKAVAAAATPAGGC